MSRSDFRLPPKHGGYRPVAGGNPSSSRKASDLPKPPSGPGGGSKKPFTKGSLKRYNALSEIIDGMNVYEPYVVIPGRQRMNSGRKSDLVYVEVINTATGAHRRFYFDHVPSTNEVIQAVHLLAEVISI